MTTLTYYTPKRNQNFIGRNHEQEIIHRAEANDSPSILVVYGRRRTGKTELIEQTLRRRSLLKFEGIQGQDQSYQIRRAFDQLASYTGNKLYQDLTIAGWSTFFEKLCDILEGEAASSVTLYLEELQWLANYDTELLAELKYFWDNRLRHLPKLLLVLCGSSPSFMINKVVRSKALHNRALFEIPVRPFQVSETKAFLGKKYTDEDVLEAQLTVGGIPEYLKYLKQDASILLSMCQNSFTSTGFFLNEIERIFVSSFADKPSYRQVIEALAERRFMTREQIAESAGVSSGGSLTELLEDLELCGFIERYSPYNVAARSRLVRYALSDNYLQFFYKFIDPIRDRVAQGKFNSSPLRALSLQSYRIFRGHAFERFCRSQDFRIAEILGFSGVDYKAGSYFDRKSLASNFQVDLLFERKDRVYTICEIKYQEAPLGVKVFHEVQEKLTKMNLKKNYRVQLVLVTAGPVEEKLLHGAYFDRVITLGELVG